MKNNYFPKQKHVSEKNDIVILLEISIMSGLIKAGFSYLLLYFMSCNVLLWLRI